MGSTSAEWLRSSGDVRIDSNVERSTHQCVLSYAVKSNRYRMNPVRDKNEERNFYDLPGGAAVT